MFLGGLEACGPWSWILDVSFFPMIVLSCLPKHGDDAIHAACSRTLCFAFFVNNGSITNGADPLASLPKKF